MSLSTILTVPMSTMTAETRAALHEQHEEFPLAIRISNEGVLLDLRELENLGVEIDQVTELTEAEDVHVGYILFDAGLDL